MYENNNLSIFKIFRLGKTCQVRPANGFSKLRRQLATMNLGHRPQRSGRCRIRAKKKTTVKGTSINHYCGGKNCVKPSLLYVICHNRLKTSTCWKINAKKRSSLNTCFRETEKWRGIDWQKFAEALSHSKHTTVEIDFHPSKSP